MLLLFQTVMFSAILFCVTGCNESKLYPYSEVVLAAGERVVAKNKHGDFSIEYIDEVSRKFEWNGNSKVIEMIPRKQRFQGKLGLYDPASSTIFDGGVRLVVSEEQIHLSDINEFTNWIIEGSDYFDWVYTRNGLVAGFGKSPNRNQVSIYLYQIYIAGEIPKNLPGADNVNIRRE